MIIVLLLFFKSICLYCQRLVLHVHDRWINPKNVRLLKEAAEAQGSKFQIEEYRRVKKSKKRRYATNHSNSGRQSSNTLPDSDSCRFCANTPQGYCRHHFHLQELHVQQQQRQQKFWCPLSGVVAGPNRATDYQQLRKIKRDLKRSIQQHQQQHKFAKISTHLYEYNPSKSNCLTPSPSASASSSNIHLSSRSNSSYLNNDSGYQTLSTNASACLLKAENSELQSDSTTAVAASYSSDDVVDIELPSSSTSAVSLVETTYSFATCCETPEHSSPTVPRNSSFSSFISCEYSTLSTTYL